MRANRTARIGLGWALASLWIGCAGGGDDVADTAVDPTASPPGDPFVEAFAGCAASLDETEDGAATGTGTWTFDERGDQIEAAWLGDTYEWRGTSVYEDHYVSSYRYDNLFGDGRGDYEVRYVWEDGHAVERTTDLGADGTDDESEFDGYNALGVWVFNHWDYEADGVIDDTNDWTWTEDGDAWHGVGVGVDPYGTYDTEGWADATGYMYRYTYDDDRGEHYEWDLGPSNALGYSASYVQRDTNGDEAWVVERTRTFDAVGRPVTVTWRTTITVGTAAPEVSVVEDAVTWDCP